MQWTLLIGFWFFFSVTLLFFLSQPYNDTEYVAVSYSSKLSTITCTVFFQYLNVQSFTEVAPPALAIQEPNICVKSSFALLFTSRLENITLIWLLWLTVIQLISATNFWALRLHELMRWDPVCFVIKALKQIFVFMTFTKGFYIKVVYVWTHHIPYPS